MVTTSKPEMLLELVQDDEHEVAFVEDQVNVEVLFNKTDKGEADKLTVGVGGIGVPIPQDDKSNNVLITSLSFIFMNINKTYLLIYMKIKESTTRK